MNPIEETQTTMIKNIEIPHATDIEKLMLGCMINSPESHEKGTKTLKHTDFFHYEHQVIFQTLLELKNDGRDGQVHSLAQRLKDKEKLSEIGGIQYVGDLSELALVSVHDDAYIEDLKKFSTHRALIKATKRIQLQAQNGEDPSKVLLEANECFRSIEKEGYIKEKNKIRFLREFQDNFLTTTPPTKPMLLEYVDADKKSIGFLPKGIVAMIVGAGGVGKTHLVAQLALSIASGTLFLDRYTTTECCGINKSGNVFLGLGENHYDDIHRLLHKASKDLRESGRSLEDVIQKLAVFSFCGQQASFIIDSKPSSYFYSLKMQLKNMAPPDGWSLIILDPISRLMGPDAETDNAVATQFIALLEELTIDLPGNPTVLLSHHTNKSAIGKSTKEQDQTASRGSSALTDGVRLQLNFAKKVSESPPKTPSNVQFEDVSILKITKSNFTKITEAIKTEKDFDGFIRFAGIYTDDPKSNIAEPQNITTKRTPSRSLSAFGIAGTGEND